MPTTFISGEIDISTLTPEKRMEIRKMLESFFGSSATENIFYETYLEFEEEWNSHEDTDNFMQLLIKMAPLLDKNSVARLMAEGDTHNDYWGAVIKKGRLYIQKYQLKPAGEQKEYIPAPTPA